MILLSNLRVLCKHVYRSSSDWISRGSCDWLHCQMLGNGSRSGALEYTDPKGTRLKGSAMHPKSHFNASQYGSLKINLVRLVYSFCFFFSSAGLTNVTAITRLWTVFPCQPNSQGSIGVKEHASVSINCCWSLFCGNSVLKCPLAAISPVKVLQLI